MNDVTETKFGYSPSEYKKFTKHAWLMLISFGLTYLFFYNGRQNINLVMSMMEKEFGSGAGAMGLVASALFWCYAFGQLVSGRLGAFFGYKKFMIFGIISSARLTFSFPSNLQFPLLQYFGDSTASASQQYGLTESAFLTNGGLRKSEALPQDLQPLSQGLPRLSPILR